MNRDPAIASVQGHSTPNCSITTRINGSPVNRDPAIASVQRHSTPNCPITTRLSPKKSPVSYSLAKSNSINVNSSTTFDSGYKLM